MGAAATGRTVAVVGLGRVGLPLAVCFADRGLDVIGVDVDARRVQAVAAGRMPFMETGMQSVLDRVRGAGRMRCTTSVAEAALADDIVLTLGAGDVGQHSRTLFAARGVRA